MNEVRVYYMYHKDSLSGLSPFLLLDGERVWHAATKRSNDNIMYYLFITESVYMKLWKDKKGNLLMYIGDVAKPMFMTGEELDVFEIDITLSYVDYIDDAMYIGNNYFKFNIPIIGLCRRLNQGATRPLAFLLYRLLMEQAHEETSAQTEEVEEQ